MKNQILEKFHSLEIGSTFIGKNIEILEKKHPDQFVAVNKNKIVAHNKDLEILMKKVKEKGEDTKEIIIEFIPVKDEIILF